MYVLLSRPRQISNAKWIYNQNSCKIKFVHRWTENCMNKINNIVIDFFKHSLLCHSLHCILCFTFMVMVIKRFIWYAEKVRNVAYPLLNYAMENALSLFIDHIVLKPIQKKKIRGYFRIEWPTIYQVNYIWLFLELISSNRRILYYDFSWLPHTKHTTSARDDRQYSRWICTRPFIWYWMWILNSLIQFVHDSAQPCCDNTHQSIVLIQNPHSKQMR